MTPAAEYDHWSDQLGDAPRGVKLTPAGWKILRVWARFNLLFTLAILWLSVPRISEEWRYYQHGKTVVATVIGADRTTTGKSSVRITYFDEAKGGTVNAEFDDHFKLSSEFKEAYAVGNAVPVRYLEDVSGASPGRVQSIEVSRVRLLYNLFFVSLIGFGMMPLLFFIRNPIVVPYRLLRHGRLILGNITRVQQEPGKGTTVYYSALLPGSNVPVEGSAMPERSFRVGKPFQFFTSRTSPL